MKDYREVRENMEKEGYRLQEDEYEKILEYTKRKAKRAGKDENYLPLLLPDVIREYFFRAYINLAGMMAIGDSNKK